MTSAFGKVILLGEHAVVYGHPALAAALGLTVEATAMKMAGPTRIEVPAWRLSASVDDLSPPGRALAAIATELGASEGVVVDCSTDLPNGAGLGSSAALAVATTRALAQITGQPLTDSQVEAIANRAEVVFHQNPSGVDVALATHGGVGIFRRGQGLTPCSLAPLPLVIALSDEPRMTAALVEKVREQQQRSAAARAALERLGSLAERGAERLRRGDLPGFGALLDSAHEDLGSLGVSTMKLDAIVAHARSHGAIGAKLTGAGGGGAVIALAPGNETALVASLQHTGYRAFVTHAGVVR